MSHWIGLAAGLGLAVATGVWLHYFPLRQKASLPPFKVIPFTSFPGYEVCPAFSPDGNQLAYAWKREKGDNYDIYVQLIGTAAPLRLTNHPDDDLSPAWSPDGRSIAFVRQSKTGHGIFLVPALGGHERKVVDLAGPPSGLPYFAWTRDGDSLVIRDKNATEDQYSLYLLSIQTGERRRLTSPSPGSFDDHGPAVSPDGKTIAFSRNEGSGTADVYVVPFAGGEPRRLTFLNAQIIDGLSWTADGREIICSTYIDYVLKLWRVGTADGKPEELGGLGENLGPTSISRQGNRLAFVQYALDAHIWRIDGLSPSRKRARAVKLIASTRLDTNARYSPDGNRIAFVSDRSGKQGFWICDSEGQNAYPLSSDDKVGAFNWSPDGRCIAFDAITKPSGHFDIYVVLVEGGVPRQLTWGRSNNGRPSWSPDGQWIYFGSDRGSDWQVWKIPSAGGQAVQVTRKGGFVALESLDGKFLYYTKDFPTGPVAPIPGLWRMPVEGGEEVQVLETLQAGLGGYWDLVDKGIFFVETVSSKSASVSPAVLIFKSFTTGRTEEITPLEKPPMYGEQGLSASPDGRWVLYQNSEIQGADIMLVENFK